LRTRTRYIQRARWPRWHSGGKTRRRGLGGYHLVWTRDLSENASRPARRRPSSHALALDIDLAGLHPAGGRRGASDSWINSDAYWRGTTTRRVAAHFLLAWLCSSATRLGLFDPLKLIAASGALPRFVTDPITGQERWEESQLLAHGRSLSRTVTAAEFARGISVPFRLAQRAGEKVARGNCLVHIGLR